MNTKRVGGFVQALLQKKYNWKMILAGLFGLIVVTFLFVINLGSLTNHQFSAGEQQAFHRSQSVKGIFENPVAAPHTLTTRFFLLFVDGPIAGRLASALFAILVVVLFFVLMKQWHKTRIALLATLLFAGSALLLHFGRWGGPSIMLAPACLALLLTGLSIKHAVKFSTTRLLCVTAIAAASVYVPGLLWFVLGFVAFGLKDIRKYLAQYAITTKFYAAGLLLALLAPMVLMALDSPKAALQGITGMTFSSDMWSAAVENIWQLPRYFALGGLENSEVWLYKAPVLDILGIVLILFGAYYYARNRKTLSRTYPLTMFAGIAFFMTVFGSFYFAPALFLSLIFLMTAGLDELLGRWLSVFPRNSLARGFGITLVTIILLLSVFYNIRQYFVAWPNNSETKATYSITATE